MKSKSFYFILFLLTAIASTNLLAADQFFEVGKSYLFTPRLSMVMKGTVVQITDQEIVFTNRYILKASKASANVKDEAKGVAMRGAAVAEYLKSDKKQSLLEPSVIKDVPTSYSRSEMTAIKLD